MEVWILLMGLYLRGDGGGISFATAEFTSEATCKAAGAAMAKEWSRGAFSVVDQSRWVCTRK